MLSAASMIPLNLVMHELGTNAIKHGALCGETGTVAIAWDGVSDPAGHPAVRITWHERGGPSIRAPSHGGFGTELLNRMSRSLARSWTLDFQPDGRVATLMFERARFLAAPARVGAG